MPRKTDLTEHRGLSTDLETLSKFGTPNGPRPEDAGDLFRRLRQTPDEARAIAVLASRSQALTEPLRVALATAMIDRGEPNEARPLLNDARSPSALLLRADLMAQANELADALAIVERVLANDMNYPGALERHERWSRTLGFSPDRRLPRRDRETVLSAPTEAPFRILREIARGGSGAVYEAEDRELARRVALKVYHRPDQDRDQLEHEARVAAALADVGIIRVFDLHPEHGWLAMELASEGSLRDWIHQREPQDLLPLEEWLAPLASSLAHIHQLGWVHLDVKPANILFRPRRQPVLSDFGAARRIGETATSGSFGFVSPERLRGRAAHPSDDVYGYGRILEETLRRFGDAPQLAQWKHLAARCTAPESERPENGKELSKWLESEKSVASYRSSPSAAEKR